MKRPLEKDVQKHCLDLLHLYRIFAWRQNTTGVYDPARKRFRTFHGLRGVSDILGILAPSGRLLCVECKRPGGVVSEDQRAFLSAVTEAGGLALVVSDVKQLEAALRVEGVI